MRMLRPGPAAWTFMASLALVASARPLIAQQEPPPLVGEGDRVRVWTGPVVPPFLAPGAPLVGRLVGLGPDTLQLQGPYNLQPVPRSAIARVELSIGHPQRLRNGLLAFAGAALVGTILAANVDCAASGDFSGGKGGVCFVVSEILLVAPVSVLTGILVGLAAPERFEDAALPPPR